VGAHGGRPAAPHVPHIPREHTNGHVGARTFSERGESIVRRRTAAEAVDALLLVGLRRRRRVEGARRHAHFASEAPERARGGGRAAPHVPREQAARTDVLAPEFAASVAAVDRTPSKRRASR